MATEHPYTHLRCRSPNPCFDIGAGNCSAEASVKCSWRRDESVPTDEEIGEAFCGILEAWSNIGPVIKPRDHKAIGPFVRSLWSLLQRCQEGG